MFGYIIPDKPYLLMKDYNLYKAVYCGICKSIKRNFGNLPRLTVTYDSVFLSIFLHNYLDIDYEIKRERCILHPLNKRGTAASDALSDKISAFNIQLAYHKMTDDIDDGSGFLKRLSRGIIVKRAYKKSKKMLPQTDIIITEMYNNLRCMEKSGEKSIDKASHPFAQMLQKASDIFLEEKSNDEIRRIFYSVGKWIYLIDAADDTEKDRKNGNYNPLLAAYGEEYVSAGGFKSLIKERLEFSFNCIYGDITDAFNKLTFNFNTDILKNILFSGLNKRMEIVYSQCPKKIRI